MKLQLQIVTTSGYSVTFEHAGPVVRIGRDVEGELFLQGEAGHAVSGKHARIDLTPSGALLADLGSRNGTLLNDQMIQGSVPLHAGDRITLGHTGPTLTVVELALTVEPTISHKPASNGSQAEPASTPIPTKVMITGAVVACVLVLIVGAWVLIRGPRKTGNKQVLADTSPAPYASSPIVPAPQRKRQEPKPPKPPAPVPPKKLAPNPLAEVREVGRFVALARWGPSVLLQRQGDAFPWLPLRPQGSVTTASTLVSLPGYRSSVALESGVFLTLWGNLPEFSSFPPVGESVVMLNTPAAGFDVDLTLERGRIHLANQKPAGSARIQLRFLRQSWELTLPDAGSEACLELWSAPATAEAQANQLWVCLFARSRAQLKLGEKVLDLAPSSRVSWANRPDAVPCQEVLKELPDWWAKPTDRSLPHVQDAMLALLDWSVQLGRSNEVIDSILTQTRGSSDASQRVIGVLFIAALDETPFLVDFLGNLQHAEVRGAARHSLQAFLLRRPQNATELVRMLHDRLGFPPEKAALVARYLHRLSEMELTQPKTYQDLIDLLDHSEPVIRELAFWHLAFLVPEGAKTIDYSPSENDEHKRRETVGQWRKLIPKNDVPHRIQSGPAPGH